MKDLDKKITFKVSSLAEYAGMLYKMTSTDKTDELPEDLVSVLETAQKDITPLLASDLTYFNSTLQLHALPKHYATYKGLTSVEAFISAMSSLSIKDCWSLVLEAVFSLPKEASDEDVLEMIENDAELLNCHYDYAYILEFKSQLESLLPRLQLFFEQFYKLVYKPLEEDVMKMVEKQLQTFVEEYLENPEIFIKTYIKVNTDDFLNKTEYNADFYVNVCNYNHASFTIPNDHPEEMYVMFGYLVAEMIREKASEELVKILGETTKMSIVKLLSKESMYASQIADQLNLNRATISHHINQMTKVGIVNMDYSEGKRIYYGINVEKIREGLNHFVEMLEGDHHE